MMMHAFSGMKKRVYMPALSFLECVVRWDEIDLILCAQLLQHLLTFWESESEEVKWVTQSFSETGLRVAPLTL